jgi:hypothetical protein
MPRMSASGYKRTCGKVRQDARVTPESGHRRRWSEPNRAGRDEHRPYTSLLNH